MSITIILLPPSLFKMTLLISFSNLHVIVCRYLYNTYIFLSQIPPNFRTPVLNRVNPPLAFLFSKLCLARAFQFHIALIKDFILTCIERAGEDEGVGDSMMSSPAGRDTELRRWGTPNVTGGGLSNCTWTAASGGGGNLGTWCGGGEGEEASDSATPSSPVPSPPLSLSAHSMLSNEAVTACKWNRHRHIDTGK